MEVAITCLDLLEIDVFIKPQRWLAELRLDVVSGYRLSAADSRSVVLRATMLISCFSLSRLGLLLQSKASLCTCCLSQAHSLRHYTPRTTS